MQEQRNSRAKPRANQLFLRTAWINPVLKVLTLWHPAAFRDFWEKNTETHMALRGNFSGLVSGTKPVSLRRRVSLVTCTRKKFWLGVVDFLWRRKWKTFRPPWPTFPGSRRQPLDGSISLKFLLETRLQCESFDSLDDLLRFQVQKLWF